MSFLTRVLKQLSGKTQGIPLKSLEATPNQVRRLVSAGLVKRVKRGIYTLSSHSFQLVDQATPRSNWKQELQETGWVWLRNIIPPSQVKTWHTQMMRQTKRVRSTQVWNDQGEWIHEEHKSALLVPTDSLEPYLSTLGLEEIPETRWWRKCLKGHSTPVHADIFYFRQHEHPHVPNDQFYTAWFPLQDLTPEQGVLALYQHKTPPFFLPPLGTVVEPQLPPHFQGNVPPTSDFMVPTHIQRGDVIIFDSHMVHTSTQNLTGAPRFSLDVRVRLSPPTIPLHLALLATAPDPVHVQASQMG